MTVGIAAPEASAIVVLARQMPGPAGGPISDQELVDARAVAVSFFVDSSVDGLGVDDIVALVGAGDGRRVVPLAYAEQLYRFATAPSGTLVVTRTARGRRYLVGRITSPYSFSPGVFPGYPHVRRVGWAGQLPQDFHPDGNRYSTVRPLTDPALRGAVARVAGGLTASRSGGTPGREPSRLPPSR